MQVPYPTVQLRRDYVEPSTQKTTLAREKGMRTKLTIPTIEQSLAKRDLIIIYNISDPEVDDRSKAQGWNL